MLTLCPATQFTLHLKTWYPLVTEMLSREMAADLWAAVRNFYVRVGSAQGLI